MKQKKIIPAVRPMSREVYEKAQTILYRPDTPHYSPNPILTVEPLKLHFEFRSVWILILVYTARGSDRAPFTPLCLPRL